MKPGAKRTARTRVAVAIGARVGLDKVLGVVPRVEGLDRVPSGAAIVAFNHLSPIDPFLLAWLLAEAGHADPVVLVRGDLPKIPVVSDMLEAGALRIEDDTPDDPEADADASHAFAEARRQVEAGRLVLVAPEGGVSPSLELMPLRSGAAQLAIATNAPLVPVGLFGTHRLFEGDRFRGRRGVPVSVAVGYPVMTSPAVRTTTRMLHLDMEALAERALDDYPDREEGESGAEWWPARRGGDAPSLATVIDARAEGREVWGGTGHEDPVGAEIWTEEVADEVPPPPDPDNVHASYPLHAMEHDEILEHYPRSYHRNAAQQGGRLRDLKLVVAFDMPGQPHEHHAVVHLDHHVDGVLAVISERGRILLADVDLRASATRVVAYGRVLIPHLIEADGGTVTVPAGTLATLLGVAQDQPEPGPIKDWDHVQSIHLRA